MKNVKFIYSEEFDEARSGGGAEQWLRAQHLQLKAEHISIQLCLSLPLRFG